MKNLYICFLAMGPMAAHSMMPATNEGRLCLSADSTVVIAQVKAGRSMDCRLLTGSTSCIPDNTVELTIKISKVIAVGTAEPGSNFVPLATKNMARQVIGRRVTISAGVRVEGHGGDLAGRVDTPLTDAEVVKLYSGRTYIFSIASARPDMQPEDVPYATVWPVSSLKWVMHSLRRANGQYCPNAL